jgi:hypothetical protein
MAMATESLNLCKNVAINSVLLTVFDVYVNLAAITIHITINGTKLFVNEKSLFL